MAYRPNQVGHEQLHKEDIDQDEEKAYQGDHVWSQPKWQELDDTIPLRRGKMCVSDEAESGEALLRSVGGCSLKQTICLH